MARLDLQIHIKLVMAPRSMALAEPRRASLLLPYGRGSSRGDGAGPRCPQSIGGVMSAVGFLGSSRQNRVLPVLTAFGLAGAHHPEKAFGSPKNVQHNMELCCMRWAGGRGRGLSLRAHGGRSWQVAGKYPAGL